MPSFLGGGKAPKDISAASNQVGAVAGHLATSLENENDLDLDQATRAERACSPNCAADG